MEKINIKEYILWLEDEVKELKGVVNNNNKLTLEQLEEVQYNLENLRRIEKDMTKNIEKLMDEM